MIKLFLILSVFLTNEIFDKLNDLQFISCNLEVKTGFVLEKKQSTISKEETCHPLNEN